MCSYRKLFLTLIIALVVPSAMQAGTPMKKSEFHDAMRILWMDHVEWTRLFIISDVARLQDTEAVTNRLLKNQSDIGNAVKPFYGDAAGEQLTSLLKEHITIAAELVEAARMKHTAKQKAASERWFANADQIAAFLSEANPGNWRVDEMKAMMKEHLELTLAEVSARLKADWMEDIATYEKVRGQALEMADMLSEGIMRQFPEKFKGPS